MPFIQGRNEQALVHAAVGFAKHSRRHATLAVTASIGPGAMNMVTGAALATVNRLPVLLLPGDTYATRHQGPVLQQLQHPIDADLTVNDAFRPVSRFFDRITRPEQLLTALPAAMRTLVDPVETGAVVLSLPQDVQSHAYDFPAEFFAERDWMIRRPAPDPTRSTRWQQLLAAAEEAADHRRRRRRSTPTPPPSWSSSPTPSGIPVAETFAGKGAVQQAAWWQVGGIGLEGTPATNTLASEADLVLTVGSRLTDFATGSHSIFANPDVRFASINVNVHDADRLGATGIIGDAKRGPGRAGRRRRRRRRTSDARGGTGSRSSPTPGRSSGRMRSDPDQLFDKSAVAADSDVVTTTDAVLTQGQIIGVLQEHARPGDVIIAAAGGPPGDLQKVWDATGGRTCHLEFGFSCMGYEIPAAIGVRLAHPDPDARITAFLGDGTFLMAPTELVTAAQEGLPITLVIPENHGYQVIHRLQMFRNGREFGNEFRYRTQPLELGRRRRGGQGGPPGRRLPRRSTWCRSPPVSARRRLRRTRPPSCARALDETRGHQGTVVIVVAGDPARRPAAGRGVVGRRARRGVRDRHRAAAARRVRAGPPDPAVVRMSPRCRRAR